ncbi:hypothetical protein [Gleimia coleocanis]|nr:hypothetical protein [Gleimia coleocanis]
MNPYTTSDYFNREVKPRNRWLVFALLLLIVQGYVLFNDSPPSEPAAWLTAIISFLKPLPGATAPGEPGFDLVVHFSSFALITVCLLLARLRPGFVLLTFGAYAALTEIIQEYLLYYRTGSFIDLVADLLGICFSLAVFLYWYRRRI